MAMATVAKTAQTKARPAPARLPVASASTPVMIIAARKSAMIPAAMIRVRPVSRPPWLMASSAKWAVIPLDSRTKVLMVGTGHHSTGTVPAGGHPRGWEPNR